MRATSNAQWQRQLRFTEDFISNTLLRCIVHAPRFIRAATKACVFWIRSGLITEMLTGVLSLSVLILRNMRLRRRSDPQFQERERYRERMAACQRCPLFNPKYRTCGTADVRLLDRKQADSLPGCFCYMPLKCYLDVNCWAWERELTFGWPTELNYDR